jgi:hypothetical protein
MTNQTARVVDLLATEHEVSDAQASAATFGDHGQHLVPDVVGMAGLEAVATVRASGLIAAIEPVVSDVQPEGVVLCQDPPAGTQMTREAVLTLQVAALLPEIDTAPVETTEQEEDVVGLDDTEEWFTTLAGTPPGFSESVCGRRSRKHRRPRPRLDEYDFDLPPAPAPTGGEDGTFAEPARARPRLLNATATMAPKQRRSVGIAFGLLLLGVLLGVTLFRSGSRNTGSPPPSGASLRPGRKTVEYGRAVRAARLRGQPVYGQQRHRTRAVRRRHSMRSRSQRVVPHITEPQTASTSAASTPGERVSQAQVQAPPKPVARRPVNEFEDLAR